MSGFTSAALPDNASIVWVLRLTVPAMPVVTRAYNSKTRAEEDVALVEQLTTGLDWHLESVELIEERVG